MKTKPTGPRFFKLWTGLCNKPIFWKSDDDFPKRPIFRAVETTKEDYEQNNPNCQLSLPFKED